MKLKTLVILLFSCCHQLVFSQTKEQVIKYNIFRVDRIRKDHQITVVHSVYYDNNANISKEEEDYGGSGNNTTLYKYLDTLLVQMTELCFYNGEGTTIRDSTMTNYRYDKRNRLLSESCRNINGELSRKKYIYNNNGGIDTVLLYDNDSTALTDKSPIVGERRYKKKVSLEKMQAYNYPDSNIVLIRECNCPIWDSNFNCKTFETIKNDSAEIMIQKYHGRQGCFIDSTESADTTIAHKKNDLIYLYENKVYSEKKYYTYKFNEFGLITEMQFADVYYGDIQSLPDTTIYKYYYRK
jgi:hypothetical protein